MSRVWDRPSLTALEIAWRWLAGVLTLALLAPVLLGSFGMDVRFGHSAVASSLPNTQALQSITVFQPVAAVQIMQGVFANYLTPFLAFLRWVVFGIVVLWNLIAAPGRTLVLLRLDTTLHARRLTIFLLGTLRTLLLGAAWFLWLGLIAYATRTTITAPAARQEDPSLVLFSAMLIGGTLILYVLCGVFSWFLYLAPLLAMQRNLGAFASLRAAIASRRDLRGKLIEINLVMNIVRIALIVLAMVLSASPLAFQSVATQEFFIIWWVIAVLLYLAASDYFHVVRAASYLSLYRVYNSAPAS